MRVFGKWLGRLLLVLVLVAAGMWAFGPYEPVDLEVSVDEAKIGGAAGLEAFFEGEEAGIGDLRPGTEKRVIWAGAAGAKTPVAVLYVHGFSSSPEELRPVPDRVAQALGANLVFTRLTGHGRPGEALAEATAQDWIRDTVEALAAARAVGEEVIVITTSTGGTLMAEAALHPDWVQGVKGIVFVSPNFGINDKLSFILTWPGARWFVPLLAGAEREWQPENEAHAKFWTTRYPTVAVLPLAALVKHAAAQDYSKATVPALFYFSEGDTVVRPEETKRIAAAWGGPAKVVLLPPDAEVVATRHVIAGDIRSPRNTEPTVQLILDWAKGL
ncbi:MAG: alpha/beta fold hydrolase [Paracoccaceae bacterium]